MGPSPRDGNRRPGYNPVMPALIGVLSLCLLAAPVSAAAPAAYQPVLARRGLDEDGLRARGYGFRDESCFRSGPSGTLVEPPLTPEQLDAALGATPSPPRAPDRRSAPRTLATLAAAERTVGGLFDGAATAVSDVLVPTPPAPPPPAPPRPPFAEAPFEGDWTKIDAGLRSKDPKRRAKALRTLAAAFAPDDAAETGLAAGAPEALRLAASAVHDGAGGTAAAVELKRELALVANLHPEQKAAFAHALTSPLTAYVALSRSHASHALDSQLYVRRMIALLAADGRTLTQFIAEADPRGRDAQEFLLRAHAYDALLPYLHRHPGEAGAIVPWLFPDGGAARLRARASQLEGFMTQLAADGRASGALHAFLAGLEARARAADEKTARRIAVFLKVNERLLPRKERPAVDALDDLLPPGLLEDAGLTPPEPTDSWPADRWTFVLHFASTSSFTGWQNRFLARGYRSEPDPDGATLVKDFGAREVRLRARLYPGDKEGFLRGAVAKRFLADTARDLRDPAVQGVIMRNHAQFRAASLFAKGASRGKLVLDGACRSAWDLQALRRACPTCSFITNTGTGQGHVNNGAVVAVIEGLARGDDWDAIGDAWAKLSPQSARIQGPWTPPYAEALGLLDAAGR